MRNPWNFLSRGVAWVFPLRLLCNEQTQSLAAWLNHWVPITTSVGQETGQSSVLLCSVMSEGSAEKTQMAATGTAVAAGSISIRPHSRATSAEFPEESPWLLDFNFRRPADPRLDYVTVTWNLFAFFGNWSQEILQEISQEKYLLEFNAKANSFLLKDYMLIYWETFCVFIVFPALEKPRAKH